MRVTVIGSNGQLGADVVSQFTAHGDEVCALTHADVELSSLASVEECLQLTRADLVVNTAAMHHVESCERDPTKAFAVNAVGARNLALVTRQMDAVLVHVSTDYVFDGRKGEPYLEEDCALPLNVYGNSKLAGEHFVRTLNPKHFVLRTSALYGRNPCRAKEGLNFVELMLKLGMERGVVYVVDDQYVSPTATATVATQMIALRQSEAYGLYHATAEGSCSWNEFAHEIFSKAGLSIEVGVAHSTECAGDVSRPHYSVLENGHLKANGLNVFNSWQDDLARYLQVERCPTKHTEPVGERR